MLVPNPAHHPEGDFRLRADGRIAADQGTPLTFSGIGAYRRRLFAACPPGPRRLAPLLREAIARGEVTGELFPGTWIDVGTPERLELARQAAVTGDP